MNIVLVLVSRSEKVENHLHRVECSERYLNEKSVPVAHRTVPETRKLKSLEFATLIALRADESGILVHILEEVEAFPLIVVEAAYYVNRVEVGSRCEGIASMVIRHIDLYTLKNLK